MTQYYVSEIPKHARKVFEGKVFAIYQWPQELYDGSTTTFEMAKRQDAVGVVAVKDGKVIMLEEEQPLKGRYWSIPGGSADPGEDPRAAAERELLEETGMRFQHFRLVEVARIGGPKIEWHAYRYVASGFIEQVKAEPGPGEKIIVHELEFDEAKARSRHNIFASPTVFDRCNTVEDLLSLPEVGKVQ